MQQLIGEVSQDILIMNSFPRMWSGMVNFTEGYFVKLIFQVKLKRSSIISKSFSFPWKTSLSKRNLKQLPSVTSFGDQFYFKVSHSLELVILAFWTLLPLFFSVITVQKVAILFHLLPTTKQVKKQFVINILVYQDCHKKLKLLFKPVFLNHITLCVSNIFQRGQKLKSHKWRTIAPDQGATGKGGAQKRNKKEIIRKRLELEKIEKYWFKQQLKSILLTVVA